MLYGWPAAARQRGVNQYRSQITRPGNHDARSIPRAAPPIWHRRHSHVGMIWRQQFTEPVRLALMYEVASRKRASWLGAVKSPFPAEEGNGWNRPQPSAPRAYRSMQSGAGRSLHSWERSNNENLRDVARSKPLLRLTKSSSSPISEVCKLRRHCPFLRQCLHQSWRDSSQVRWKSSAADTVCSETICNTKMVLDGNRIDSRQW